MTVNRWGLEPIIVLLFAAVLFFAFIVIGVATWLPKDGQTFSTMTALLGGFSGALFARINPTSQKPNTPIPDPQNPLGLNKPGAVT